MAARTDKQPLHSPRPFGRMVFDVTNPRIPSKIAELEIGGRAWGVATQGNYAYVANNEHMVVVDMSNPRAPREIGRAHV